MTDQSIDYGRYLQSQRRAKGMTLAEVSQKTKITKAVLQQIENEDWAGLPAPTFVKGFLRAYAEAVGADAQEAIRRYAAAGAIHQQVESSQAPPSRPVRFWLRMALIGLVFVVLVGLTIHVARLMDRPSEPPVVEDAVPPETVPPPIARPDEPVPRETPPPPEPRETPPPPEPRPTPQPMAPETAALDAVPRENNAVPPAIHDPETDAVEPVAAPPPKDPLVLTVTAVETTWLRITRDQEEPREMTLRPGQTTRLEADTGFQLLIGNAGGVRLALNDETVQVPGRSGQVVTLRLP